MRLMISSSVGETSKAGSMLLELVEPIEDCPLRFTEGRDEAMDARQCRLLE